MPDEVPMILTDLPSPSTGPGALEGRPCPGALPERCPGRPGRLGGIQSLGAVAALGLRLTGGPVELSIPNGSFETPATDFVSTRIDRWQEDPAPEGYSEAGGFAWDQLTGIFRNTAPGATDHLANLDGRQALYLFAIPGVGMFQDASSRDWNDPEPAGDFRVHYEPGATYTLGALVQGGGGGMREGVPLELSLYYRDASGTRMPVARTEVVHSKTLFADRQNLVRVAVTTARVQAADPWAGQPVGIGLRSTVGADLAGGYWDVDALTLHRQSPEGPRLDWAWVTGSGPRRLRVEWASQADESYRVEASTDGKAWSPMAGGPIRGTGARVGWTVDPERDGSLWLRVVAQRGS